MAAPPFLKSNRVEDIRDALNQLYRMLSDAKTGTASATSANIRSVVESYVLQNANAAQGKKGDPGKPGKDSVSTITTLTLSPVFTRSENVVPVSTRTGDLVCNSTGRLVTARSMDEVPLFDSQNELITE